MYKERGKHSLKRCKLCKLSLPLFESIGSCSQKAFSPQCPILSRCRSQSDTARAPRGSNQTGIYRSQPRTLTRKTENHFCSTLTFSGSALPHLGTWDSSPMSLAFALTLAHCFCRRIPDALVGSFPFLPSQAIWRESHLSCKPSKLA